MVKTAQPVKQAPQIVNIVKEESKRRVSFHESSDPAQLAAENRRKSFGNQIKVNPMSSPDKPSAMTHTMNIQQTATLLKDFRDFQSQQQKQATTGAPSKMKRHEMELLELWKSMAQSAYFVTVQTDSPE